MNYVFRHLKENKIIYIVIFLFLLAKSLSISNYKTVWWDSAVYIGMGKYIYSLGDAGLWENSRPIVWPLILGFLWKIGLDVIVAGRVAEILLGGMCILLTYKIGKRLFDRRAALLASLFLALSPTFFFFNGVILTEIVSTFFSLAAVYFFIDKKYFYSGLFFGIAFMARFLQLFAIIGIFFALIFSKNNTKIYSKILLGLTLATAPFLILNQALYNNPFFPFLQQAYLSSNSGWPNYHSTGYYFTELFKENFLYLLFIPGLILALKQKDASKKSIAAIFAIFFIFFNLIKQKEMRFLIVMLPYMYLLVSYPIIYFIGKSRNNLFRNLILLFAMLSFALSFVNITAYYGNESAKADEYSILQNKLEQTDSDAIIWISNPVIAASSDRKIGKMMYYPIFNEEKKNELAKEIGKADFVFMDSCDLACRPSDAECEDGKKEILSFFRQKLKTVYSSEADKCQQFVFQK